MLSCKEAAYLVSMKLDCGLPFWRRLSLRLHVLMCRACSRYMRQVTTLNRMVAERYRCEPASDGAEDLSEEALQRIKAFVRSAKPDDDSANAE